MYKKKELQLSYFSICEGKKLDDKIVTYFALKAGSTVYIYIYIYTEYIYIYIYGQTRLHYPARLRARVKTKSSVALKFLWYRVLHL